MTTPNPSPPMADPLTAEDLAALRALLGKATAGEWGAMPTPNGWWVRSVRQDMFCRITVPVYELEPVAGREAETEPNASLIAAAVTRLPALLDAAEREKRLEEALREIKLVLSSPASRSARITGAFEVARQALGDRP